MRFLVDESTGPVVAEWLIEQGHEVFSVYDLARGIDDDDIVEKAYKENWLLITNDKDFGDKVFHEQKPHHGVILLRLDDERPPSKIAVLKRLLQSYADRLPERFVVATEDRVRFARR
jgi:predicted nuclease of predicted toxin-antitoxin system